VTWQNEECGSRNKALLGRVGIAVMDGVIRQTGFMKSERQESLKKEADEIVAMTVESIETAKGPSKK
jgi:hypothetical protein